MGSLQKLIDFLRSKEISEDELKIVYTQFFREEYDRGFNNGCEYVRFILRKQKSARNNNVRKNFNKLSDMIEDYLNESN